ncbi:hypothetical protein IFM89_001695 [Coptis chinensis]|uniref:Pectinesterase n=1 Tax=Coptis chinensis TaxID=261450 RepID=A0A835HK03_9MAGN|nr:hypothetical protein IFM89_001695 [Coptis chinensis]
MMGKVAVAGVSLILVVGVIIGVVATVSRSNGDNSSGHATAGLSTGMKAVETLCAPTDFKDSCINTLAPIANKNGKATPKELVEATFVAAQEEVKKAWNTAGELAKNATGSYNKASMEGCNELLEYAFNRLQGAISSVGKAEFTKMTEHKADIKNYLSAVLAYKSTCFDDIEDPELKKTMEKGITYISEITTNGLAIVDEVSKFLNKINDFQFFGNNNNTSRRLLDTEVDKDGFPTWFSAADRRLLAARPNQIRPNAVVAKDGSGQFKTISQAIAAYPKGFRGRYIIYVKAGIYNEKVTVPEKTINVYMYGDGPRRTIVTGSDNFGRNKTPTWKTATFSAIGDGFIVRSMGFQNTAGPDGHQAVAFRSQSDMSAVYNCRIDGHQDTLYYHAQRQFYRNCVISGTIDFIFGSGTALIQNSKIILRQPNPNQRNTVTADGRQTARCDSGLVIQTSKIVPEMKYFPNRFKIPSYLGRPWKVASRTIVMESVLADVINPDGWYPWNPNSNENLDTCEYREYRNSGPGANTNRRIKWRGFAVITDRRVAERFTAGPFLRGDLWLRNTGAQFSLGLHL